MRSVSIQIKMLILFVMLLAAASKVEAQSQVKLVRQNGRFRLLLDGKPFQIKGVGGETRFAELAAAGGNAVRTWGAEKLGPTLDRAHKHKLAVCAGLWMGHQRHGFDYQNQAAVLKQLEESLAVVRKFKDHPALLLWAVGNEMEGEGRDPSVWYAVNHIAREIKRIDPHHPTMTVIAEIGENASKVKAIERFCPDIDIIGVNAYGGIESLGERYRAAGGTRPYIVTEHGTHGPWEVGKTDWGSPIEFTSTQKARMYARGYRAAVLEQPQRCLGSFAFIWGHKQETTATWFGMLLPDGSRLGAVDAMQTQWTGKPPKNRCPQIESLRLNGRQEVKPGETIQGVVTASDPEGDTLRYEWVLRSDSGTIGSGGDPQERESEIKDAVRSRGKICAVKMPKAGGGYRLFVYIYDGHGGAAVANLPLRVNAPIQLKRVMPAARLPYVIYADDWKGSAYAPSGYMGNVDAVHMQLDCRDNPHSGKTCLKAEYRSGAAWGGVLWQSPAGDWDGKKPGGANLTGARYLEFWVRGARGGEKVNFVFGVLSGNQPYRDTAKGELKDVQLTREWKRLRFPLQNRDLRQIKTGFGWSLAGQKEPVTFYLDDIRFVAE